MKTLTLVTGLPYSGKSTKIREIIEKGKEVTVRLSRKDMKTMLQPHIAGKTLAFLAVDSLICHFLDRDISVAIEEDPGEDPMFLKEIAKDNKAKFKHIHLKTPMSKCIDRAQKDNKNAIIPHIINTALRFNLYDDTTRPFYIVDITNKATVTDKAIKKMEAAAREKQDIILISTDPESRRETEKWLIDKKLFACGLPINTLIMAEDGDKRSGPAIRKWIIETYNLNKFIKKPESQK